MMILSDRLELIASKIEKGETMADIGTDHGFLPLYLFDKGVSPRVIMTDISRASLEKAIRNAQSFYGEQGYASVPEEICFRTGDGLATLAEGEVDVVVMAGIGGRLMCDILAADPEKSKSFSKLIMQPRKHPGHIRRYLLENGYDIIDESLVREGKFICEIITAKPSECSDETDSGKSDIILEMMKYPPDSIVWEAPMWYSDNDSAIGREYIERKLKREQLILKSKESGRNADTGTTKNNIVYLEKLLAGIKGE